MKTRLLIIISCLVFFVFYAAIISYAQGPDDIFNIAMILYFPGIVMQLMANEGNGIICVDACGPCSAWGYNYVLVNGNCKIPDKVEDCYFIDPPMEWEFVNDKCIPVEKYGCADNEIYDHGICMTPKTKERAESIEEPEQL